MKILASIAVKFKLKELICSLLLSLWVLNILTAFTNHFRAGQLTFKSKYD